MHFDTKASPAARSSRQLRRADAALQCPEPCLGPIQLPFPSDDGAAVSDARRRAGAFHRLRALQRVFESHGPLRHRSSARQQRCSQRLPPAAIRSGTAALPPCATPFPRADRGGRRQASATLPALFLQRPHRWAGEVVACHVLGVPLLGMIKKRIKR